MYGCKLKARLGEFWRRIEKQDFDDAEAVLVDVPQASLCEGVVCGHKENDVVRERHGMLEELSNLGPWWVGDDPVEWFFIWRQLNFEKVSAGFDFSMKDH